MLSSVRARPILCWTALVTDVVLLLVRCGPSLPGGAASLWLLALLLMWGRSSSCSAWLLSGAMLMLLAGLLLC